MRIIVNHLTRMQPGWICAAGVACDTGRHIRPVADRPLSVDLLARSGGPFALGRVLELGETEFYGRMPEIEDRRFKPESVQVVDELDPSALYRWCTQVAADDLRDIFGPDLEWIHRQSDQPGTAAVPEQRGIRSLGCYWARAAALQVVHAEGRRKVRLYCEQDATRLSIAVADIRLYREDHVTPDEQAIADMQAAIAGHPRTLVSVGLSRAHRYDESQPARHWLQINNIHLPPSTSWARHSEHESN
jgi:hypothetical protein